MAVTFIKRAVPNPREIKQLADKLIEAENELLKLQAEWKAIFTTVSEQDVEGMRSTLSDRILDLLNTDESRTFTSVNVSQALSANPNSVGPLLSRLLAEGKIRKIGYGEYRANSQPTDWMNVHEYGTEEESPEALLSNRA